MLSRRTRLTTAALLSTLVAAACTQTADTPEQAAPSTVAGATATPLPPTPTRDPDDASPSPSPADPAPEPDGCPPPHGERTTLPAAADEIPQTANDLVTESPSGRPISVNLPTLDGSPAARTITSRVRAHVQDVIDAWDRAVGPPATGQEGPEPELNLEVTVVRLGERLVSLELDGYRYLGGASGDAVGGAWTFATATGEQLALADVGLGGPCTDEVGQLAAEALQEDGVGMFAEGEQAVRAGEVSLERWAVTDQELHIHFPEYEIAPGAAGAPVAEVPLAELRSATGTPLGA